MEVPRSGAPSTVVRRAFIVGAALSGVHNEPRYLMFRAKAAAPDLGNGQGTRETGELSKRQLEFLQQFAVCRVIRP